MCGLFKRKDSVYACIIPNARADSLIHIIRETLKPDSIVYIDSFISYNALDVSEISYVTSTATKFTFASAAKIALINFYFAF